MKLSIITINYNNRAGLEKTMQSVLAQTTADFEWIVVDGASTDGSAELIQHHARRLSWWVSEKDSGIYNAMNKGVRHATADYLLFLNSGDVLADSTVVECILPLLSGADFVAGNMYKSEHMGQDTLSADTIADRQKLLKTLSRSTLMHPATFISRAVFNRFGPYREDVKIVSDWWLFYSAIILGSATVKYAPVVVSIFDETGISSVNRQVYQQERERLLAEQPYLYLLHTFYNMNLDIVEALKGNRIIFNLFRIYFYFYRKRHHTGDKR